LKATIDTAVAEEKPVDTTETFVPSNLVEEEIECTICGEPINIYEPEYFNEVEINPACDNCKTQPVETQIQSDELDNSEGAAELDSFPHGYFDAENVSKLEKARSKIRLRVKAKLENRCRNGELSRNDITDLEEELVTELEMELLEDFEEKNYLMKLFTFTLPSQHITAWVVAD
jgi:hypothetical protein